MNYNDFPILNNNEYTFLNEQFQKTKFNRKDILTEACTILNLIVNVNLSNKEKFNNKISIAINKAIETSNKWLNNFSSQFSIKTQCSNISTMTVFSVLKKFNNLTTKLLILMKNETKEYNKLLVTNCINEITFASSNILEALNESYLILFKHM